MMLLEYRAKFFGLFWREIEFTGHTLGNAPTHLGGGIHGLRLRLVEFELHHLHSDACADYTAGNQQHGANEKCQPRAWRAG